MVQNIPNPASVRAQNTLQNEMEFNNKSYRLGVFISYGTKVIQEEVRSQTFSRSLLAEILYNEQIEKS